MTLSELNLILDKINKSNNYFDLFIETGSYFGETLNNIKLEFKKLVSIEITEKYSKICKSRFVNNSNVEIIMGDSVLKLPELITLYKNTKTIFFLDGHYSAGDTGKNELDCPLLEELKIINKNFNANGLIIIDDADLFEYSDQYICWIGINETNILNVLNGRISNYFYVSDERSKNKKRLIIELNEKSISNW